MNKTPTPQVEKTGLDDKKKNAMLRYIGIMFVVAFVFVLVSMLGELRTSEATITELNQSSTSALQKAEQLQDTNRQLETDNAYLTGRIEELEKQLADAELDLAVSQEKADTLKSQLADLETELAAAETEHENRQMAYDLLVQALSVSAEKQPSIVSELDHYKQYLGENALKIYENLSKEGE